MIEGPTREARQKRLDEAVKRKTVAEEEAARARRELDQVAEAASMLPVVITDRTGHQMVYDGVADA